MDNLMHQRVSITSERSFACEHLKEDDAKRIDIRSSVCRLCCAARLLGRHISRSPQESPFQCHRHFRGFAFRETKVHDVRRAIAIHHDVGRLQVAMNHAVVVGMLECIGDGCGIVRMPEGVIQR